MKIIIALLTAAATLVPSAHALAQPAASACFMTRDLRNNTVGDDRTLYFDVGGRSVVKVVMRNNCFAGTTSSDPIVLRQFGGSGRICRPMDLDVGVRGTSCIVETMTTLSPSEVAALPKKLKP